MANITLSVDDDLLRKVRKIAVDKDTTLTALIRGFLRSLADREQPRKERAVRALGRSFESLSRDMGPRTWSREDLHDRSGG